MPVLNYALRHVPEIKAIKWDGSNAVEIANWANATSYGVDSGYLQMSNPFYILSVAPGSYVVLVDNLQFTHIEGSTFEQTYRVEENKLCGECRYEVLFQGGSKHGEIAYFDPGALQDILTIENEIYVVDKNMRRKVYRFNGNNML